MASEHELLKEALAGLLRDFGTHAFDVERQDARRTATQFDAWAQHLLVGTEAPLAPRAATSATAGPRLAELRRQFVAHRRLEQSEHTQGKDALRDVVWSFVRSLNTETQAELLEHGRLTTTLESLTQSLHAGPVNELRKVALQAVSEVQTVLAERRARHQRRVEAMSQQLSSLGSQLEVARRDSTLDGLTQLFNRRAFDAHLAQTVMATGLAGGTAALVMVDIDHFKKVNDQHGHPAGDAVIRAVAQCCARVFKRRSDFVARYGGEELVVLATDVSPSEARRLAEQLRRAVEGMTVAHEGVALTVTVSLGVAMWGGPVETEAKWLARADQALYGAKHEGRNRVNVDLSSRVTDATGSG